MSTNEPDSLDPPPSRAQDHTLRISTSPRNISTFSSPQNPQYLSNSPQEVRYSVSPREARHLSAEDHRLYASPTAEQTSSPRNTRNISPDGQRRLASPTAEELYTYGEPFPEMPEYPPHVADPLVHIQQPSDSQDGSQMPREEVTSFAGYFTLITDSTMGVEDGDRNPKTPTTHHPCKIHYIFSDDEDCEELKEACLRSLPDASNTDISNSNSITNKSSGELRTSGSSSSSKSTVATKKENKDTQEKQREERVIIIDMNETGDRVVRAQSLSNKWQVIGCEIGKAPIFESVSEEGGEKKEKGGGLMLRIDGVGIPVHKGDKELSGSREKGKGKETNDMNEKEIGNLDLDKILEGFDKRMDILRKVIGGVGWDLGEMGLNNFDGEEADERDEERDMAIAGLRSAEEEQREREAEGEAFEAS
ncbi:hypothetical protein EAE96_000020 [Botrytis aclada]|nr:hypothetical protein EAE96_000020 [Botrytis aclada]